jgi:hypothetical protein
MSMSASRTDSGVMYAAARASLELDKAFSCN